MIEEYQIRILPEQAASEEGIKRYLSKEKGIDVRTLNQVRVLKRSIDARQRTIYVNLKVRAYINEFAQDDQYIHTEYPDVSSRPRVVVVGEGPGGLFCFPATYRVGLSSCGARTRQGRTRAQEGPLQYYQNPEGGCRKQLLFW